MHHKTALAAVVLLVVGAVGVGVAAVGPQHADASPVALAQDNATNETGNATAGNVTNATANVTFLNQTTNGTYVVVNRTSLPEGGFVAIHLAVPAGNATGNATGAQNLTYGAVIGHSEYLSDGVHTDVVVTLNQSINESQYLIAMPHRDTNDNRTYDFPAADGPYVQDGTPVTDMAYVEVAQNATLAVPAGNATNATMGGQTDNETAGNATTGNSSGGGTDY